MQKMIYSFDTSWNAFEKTAGKKLARVLVQAAASV